MQFASGSSNVFVYIPIIIGPVAPNNNADVVDLTLTSLVSNSIYNLADGSSLSPFNFFDMTDYNQWYTAVNGPNTVLTNKFIYAVSNTTFAGAVAIAAAPASTLTAITFNVATTGDKLCYASPSFGNFQTQLR